MGLLRRFAPRNDSKQVNRLRNKCAMTGYDHAELVSVSCGLKPLSCLSGTLSTRQTGLHASPQLCESLCLPKWRGERLELLKI